ncbi:hypothetical protein [Brevibacillus sp. H7]|uniref:hypothetical protein n=1 Tax=Brevibacillus sp. H7 TaxID=3349138 RepID=UPI0037F9CA2C
MSDISCEWYNLGIKSSGVISMWVNPFPRIETGVNAIEQMSFEDAQAFVNFVILVPAYLPEGTVLAGVTVRKETSKTRSSIRFEVIGQNRTFRVKQFFYDWSIPGIYADTNLVGQGEPFVLHGVAGFIGRDYKGNDAVAYARWFTQVEISVLTGQFSREDLLSFCNGLVPAVPAAVSNIGEKAYAVTSHTARFHVPRWSQDDPINRVHWQAADLFDSNDSSDDVRLPPIQFQDFIWDSVGRYHQADAMEYQILLRDENNHTDCIWIWCAPKSLASPFPETFGANIGKRTRWNIERIWVSELSVILCEQATAVPGWQLHWKTREYDYHIHIRANNRVTREHVVELAKHMINKNS